VKKTANDLKADDLYKMLQRQASEIGANEAERALILSQDRTVQEVLDQRESDRKVWQQAQQRPLVSTPDEPRATPSISSLVRAVSSVKGYTEAVKRDETRETDKLAVELEPVIAEASKIRLELEQVQSEYGAAISAVLSLDFARLRSYRNTGSLLDQLHRIASMASGLLQNALWLGSVPQKVKQVKFSSFPAAEASTIRRAVEGMRDTPQQVVSFVKQLESMMAELQRRLSEAGEPVKLLAPQTIEMPKLGTPPPVVRDLPVDPFRGE
jgi:hypothetical protein